LSGPADDASERTREVFAGLYELEAALQRGASGSVYRARHVATHRPVALKILRVPDDPESGVDFERRFRNEARALQMLDHAHIVRLHDWGETEDGRCFLAMELVDGHRLGDLFKDQRMPASRVVPLLLQVCDALRYAHSLGIVHRDLKPSNLLVQRCSDGSELIKVVDFGLVKLLDGDQESTRVDHVLGSPHCMAPEQVAGTPVTPAADVYALGVILFRALTGRYPFSGSNAAVTMMGHLNGQVPTFAAVAPDLEPLPGLEDIVRKCLQKAPADRFESMDDLADALLIGHVPETLTLTLEAPPNQRTERFVLVLAAVFFVLAVTLAVAAWRATGVATAAPTTAAPPAASALAPPDEASDAPSGPAKEAPTAAPAKPAPAQARPAGPGKPASSQSRPGH